MTTKTLAKFSFKSETTKGNLCKTICLIRDNGIVELNQLILSDEQSLDGFDTLYSKFGKTLFVKAIGFKYSSLVTILKTTNKVLFDNNIDPDNIL